MWHDAERKLGIGVLFNVIHIPNTSRPYSLSHKIYTQAVDYFKEDLFGVVQCSYIEVEDAVKGSKKHPLRRKLYILAVPNFSYKAHVRYRRKIN